MQNKNKSLFSLICKKIKGVNIIKTIYANFAYFSINTAIKFPIFVYGKTIIKNANKGKINIKKELIKPGLFRIGTPVMDCQPKSTITLFNIKGNLNIYGNVSIGKGSLIEVCNEGVLTIGNCTSITANTTILCTHHINIGENCIISWDNLIMDTDWHNIVSAKTGEVYSKQKSINIGNHVWIGCRCTILKGTSISDDVIIASNSKVSKKIDQNNVLIGSNIVLRENVTWK